MLKIKAIRLKNIKVSLGKLPKMLAKKAFLVFLGLFILSLTFGVFIFYEYRTKIREGLPEAAEKQLKFRTEIYNNILEIWQKREKIFKQTSSKSYPNPFVAW
jgi:hypothetical protein